MMTTIRRVEAGRVFTVHVIEGLRCAGAVLLGGEIVVGKCSSEAETESRITSALQAAALQSPEIA